MWDPIPDPPVHDQHLEDSYLLDDDEEEELTDEEYGYEDDLPF